MKNSTSVHFAWLATYFQPKKKNAFGDEGKDSCELNECMVYPSV